MAVRLREIMSTNFALIALVLLALALKILAAPDAVAGLGHPQPMTAIANQAHGAGTAGHVGMAKAFHHGADHPCSCPEHCALPQLRCQCTSPISLAVLLPAPSALAPVFGIVAILMTSPLIAPMTIGHEVIVSPGRGMAAPPPWSHAPPVLRP